MNRSLPSLALALAATFCLAAAAAPRALAAASPAAPREIARVAAAPGDYVAWFETAEGAIEIGIAATFPNRPLVAAEFADRHDAREVFLAVASPKRPLPEALAALAPAGADEAADRLRLRRENAALLARLPLYPAPAGPDKAAGCTAFFRDWAGDVYGDSTCGDPSYFGFDTTYPAHTYCTSGCTYQLGVYDKDTCTPKLKSCDIVRGQATNRRLRATATNGNASMSHFGHRAHFAAANCSGNGAFIFNRQRGGGSIGSIDVPVNSMYHYYLGSPIAPATAQDLVSYGSWENGTPPSGATYLDNDMWLENNAGTDDRAIVCGDVQSRYDMSDVSSPSCHGAGISLCHGGDCDSPCFSCSGGSCG